MQNLDIDGDGKVTDGDISKNRELLEIELREEKAQAQKKMAWVALISSIGFTAVLFSSAVSVERVEALSNTLDWFYITQAGIVGAFMGATAFMSKR